MIIPKHVDFFVKEMERRNFSQMTIKNYRSCLALFISKIHKEHPLHINENDIREYLSTEIYTHVSKLTISKINSPINQINIAA